jgi:deoxyadenosine/deoxycytidine kinase
MFRQLDKIQNINSQYKSKISNNYEKIYQYVVQSSKIGSTGEMIEFNKNKQLIQNIIEDIIQI